jgi:hypothetical protein
VPEFLIVFEGEHLRHFSDDMVVIISLRRRHQVGRDLPNRRWDVLVSDRHSERVFFSFLYLHWVLDDLIKQLESFMLVVHELTLQLKVVLLQMLFELKPVIPYCVLRLVFVKVLQ